MLREDMAGLLSKTLIAVALATASSVSAQSPAEMASGMTVVSPPIEQVANQAVPSIEIKVLDAGIVMEVSGEVDDQLIETLSIAISETIKTDKPAPDATARDTQGQTKWLSCNGWGQKWVGAGNDFQFYFFPGRSGHHEIRFYNSHHNLWAGFLKFYWRNPADNVTSWQYFATDQTERLPDQKERTLYSGTADVEYRFVYSADYTGTFYWQLCTD